MYVVIASCGYANKGKMPLKCRICSQAKMAVADSELRTDNEPPRVLLHIPLFCSRHDEYVLSLMLVMFAKFYSVNSTVPWLSYF